MPMDDRLAQLLDSYAQAQAHYTLARLEYALHHPAKPAPPPVTCCVRSTVDAVREQWSRIEAQLDAALGYVVRMERERRRRRATDSRFRYIADSLRELDRSSRAVRWALTISESHYDLG
jgi:hypothetical protein